MPRALYVSEITPSHEAQWRRLMMEYGAESDAALGEKTVERLWSWILDSQHQITCAVVADPKGDLLGFVHFRLFERALTASTGVHIEDIFVTVRARGQGIVDALLNHVFDHAAESGSDLVSWITSDDNYRARAAYDRHADPRDWVVYERAIGPLSAKER